MRAAALPGRTTLSFGATTPGTGTGAVTLALDATGPLPVVELGATWTLPDVGPVTLQALRLSAAGVSVDARLGPVPVQAGPVSLRPVLEVHAGTQDPADRLLAVGLALDDDAARSVQVRWGLDARPPVLAAVTHGTGGSPDAVSTDDAPAWLLSVAVGLAGGILVDALDDLLDARATRILRGVVLAEDATAATPAVDASFALDLLDPTRLLARLERLAWNAATDTEPLSLLIDDLVRISLTAGGAGDDRVLGLGLTLDDDERFTLAEGSVTVELEVDASWLEPAVAAGLSIDLVHAVRTPGTAGAPATYAFSLEPGVSVAGLGLRFTNVAGPLLELGPVSLDAIAFRVYAEARATGVGGGAQLELAGLAFAPTGGSGTNAVAESILSDAAESSPSARPAFSPALAIQRHPGEDDARVTVRVNQPPGPWWVVVQRQLGPLYLEQVGFDAAEVDGRVSHVTLLFDGRVEIFGLTAAVDQLSLTWLGRRPLRRTALGGRPPGPGRLRRPVRDLPGRRDAQDHRRRRRVLRRDAAGQVRHLRALGLRRLHRRRRQPVVLRLRRGQRTHRRPARVLRHRARRRARDQPPAGDPRRPEPVRLLPLHRRRWTPTPRSPTRCRRCAT